MEKPRPFPREEELAYAAGWTISGLATLGTIIAVSRMTFVDWASANGGRTRDRTLDLSRVNHNP